MLALTAAAVRKDAVAVHVGCFQFMLGSLRYSNIHNITVERRCFCASNKRFALKMACTTHRNTEERCDTNTY